MRSPSEPPRQLPPRRRRGPTLDAALAAGRGWADLAMVVDVNGKAVAVAPTGAALPAGIDKLVDRGLTEGLVYVEVAGQAGPAASVVGARSRPAGRSRTRGARAPEGPLRPRGPLGRTMAGQALGAADRTREEARGWSRSRGPKVELWTRRSGRGTRFSAAILHPRGRRRAAARLRREPCPGRPGLSWRLAVAEPATSAVVGDTLGVVSPAHHRARGRRIRRAGGGVGALGAGSWRRCGRWRPRHCRRRPARTCSRSRCRATTRSDASRRPSTLSRCDSTRCTT